MKRLSGRLLNEKWGVGALHALYHRPGRWYHLLERFPGALFDQHGYVVFESRDKYQQCSHLQIGQELHVPAGISAIPGYVKVTKPPAA
jgi:hypothetical protein